MKIEFFKIIFSLSLIFCPLVLIACAHKAETLNSPNNISPTTQPNQNKPASGLVTANACYESSSSNKFYKCLVKNKINLQGEIDNINKLIINKIETQFDGDGNQFDKRYLEAIEFQKEAFSKSAADWKNFVKEDCDFSEKRKPARDSFSTCCDKRLKLRFEDLYDNYFVAYDDDTVRKKRRKDQELLEEVPCDKTNTGGTIEINECESQRLKKAQDKLEKLISKIHSRSPAYAQIISVQRKWNDFVENRCNASENYLNAFGTALTWMELVCLDIATEKRIIELKNLYE